MRDSGAVEKRRIVLGGLRSGYAGILRRPGRYESRNVVKLSASARDGLSRARLLRTVEDRHLETPSHVSLWRSPTRDDARWLK